MKIYIIASFFFLVCHVQSFGQWTLLTSPTGDQLSDVSFISADTGYAGGLNGKVYKTTDGGSSWDVLSIGKTANIFSIVFSDHLNGNLCTGSQTNGTIYNTNDGGKTWNSKASSTRYLLDMHFVDDKIGYCVGYSGKILKTIDGGQNWVSQTSNTTEDLRGVHFVDKDTGYIVAAANEILRTTDGGNTWNSYTRKTKAILLAVYFTSAKTGFAVGGNGLILKTNDAGASWNEYSNSVTGTYQFVMFADAMVGYAVGEAGLISTTVDGGKHWHSQNFGGFAGRYGWYGLDMVDGVFYASGYEGKVARNTCLPSGGIDVAVSCGPFTWVDGKTYTQSNSTAQFKLNNTAGCDSFATLNLTVNTIDLSVDVAGNSITSNETDATYQWVDCDDNNAAIPGETSKSFTAKKTGNYAAIITKNNCTDTSDCNNVKVLSVAKAEQIAQLLVYPNPTKSHLNLDFGKPNTSASYQIYDVFGQLLYKQGNINQKVLHLTFPQPPGLYWVKVKVNGNEQVLKLIKN